MPEIILSWTDRLVSRPWLCALVLAALSFGGAAALDLASGLPAPGGQDEASYWLAADTFASGRLANPTHPLWEHFETFHVIQRPMYVSKYPPMQGLVLATGQVVFGHPAAGIWLGTAFMCAAIYWMLLAWLPGRWALLGGLFALGQFGIVGYWAHTYWGGAVAAGAGALVFGSGRRIVRRPSAALGWTLAGGLGMLANTRPFEGLILALFAAVPIGFAFWRKESSYRRAALSRMLPPLFLGLGLCAGATGYYHWRTTGNPFQMPYQVYTETYSPYPLIQLGDRGPLPDYRHEVMRDLYVRWEQRPSPISEPARFGFEKVGKAVWLYIFYLGVFGTLPLLALRRAWSGPWFRYASATVISLSAVSLLTFAYPHYLAPATALIVFMAIEACRCLPQIRWKSIGGRRLLELTIVFFLAGLIARVELHFRPIFPNGFERQREEVRRDLEAIPGDHLVVVRYTDGHLLHNEWVFNGADIDASRIVWARDMGEERNAELLSYFADRTTWLLQAGVPAGAKLGHKEEVVKLERYADGRSSISIDDGAP